MKRMRMLAKWILVCGVVFSVSGCGGKNLEAARHQEEVEAELAALRKAVKEMEREAGSREKEIAELRAKASAEAARREALGGLDAEDEAVGREAVRAWVKKGVAALEPLRKIAYESEVPRARKRAKDVIGRLTGQWGSHTDLVWKRSVAEAVNRDRPILVLQLFGNLDEEFC